MGGVTADTNTAGGQKPGKPSEMRRENTDSLEVIAMRKLIPVVGPLLAAVLGMVPILGAILAAVVA